MASFYLDENMPERLTEALEQNGHDAISTRTLGQKGTSDPRQLVLAADLNRVVITHNESDFTLLSEAWLLLARWWTVARTDLHAGIVVIRQSERLLVPEMADHVHALTLDHKEFANRLFVFSGGVWRQPDQTS